MYWIVVRHAFEEDNAALADKLFAVRADLRAPNGPQALGEQLKSLHAGERTTYSVRVLNSQGTVAETPQMNPLLPPGIFPPPQSSNAPAAPKDFRTGGQLFSLVTITEEVAGQTFTIQVAQDRSEDDHFMKEFAGLLAGVLALGALAAAGIAFTVTKRGLQPLGEMTQSLRRVGPKQLHERLPPENWPRELRSLAVAFDDMLDRLEDSFTRLSQFSADLAHELRTPIANILGEAEVALTRPRAPEEYCEVLESAVTECQRLTHIVDNLLFLARTEAAEGHCQRTTFAGRAAIEKIAEFYQPVAEEQKLMLRCSGEGNIVADRMLFDRAVSNLVENALHHTPAGGTISISIANGADQSEVAVTDTGSGIASEHLTRVFDRFYRADSSRSSEGLGLGLALVKSITDLHGGSASVESELNRGTKVSLTFPNL